MALGIASDIAALYVDDKSLVTVSTLVNFLSSFTTESLSLPSITLTFFLKSLSVMIEQYISLFLVEKSSIPMFLWHE